MQQTAKLGDIFMGLAFYPAFIAAPGISERGDADLPMDQAQAGWTPMSSNIENATFNPASRRLAWVTKYLVPGTYSFFGTVTTPLLHSTR